MLILVDSYSPELLDEEIPEDVRQIAPEFAALATAEEVSRKAPTGDVSVPLVLDRWDVKTHTY
jgi:hypothetical protein